MCKPIMFRYCIRHCRKNPYFVVGLCLGFSLSLVFSSIYSHGCTSYSQFNPNNSKTLIKAADEYEPIIDLAGKPLKAQKTPQLLIRPRYYSTELNIREKLFIGVLTSQNTITTYGVALNKSVSHLVDKVMFFIDAPGSQKANISMPGIVGFTDTRQILKPFHMLKYITDNYLDEFDFFFFVKDTTYIRARMLYELVHGTSVSENVHVGSGKKDSHTSFCSFDAGLLLSNSVMQKILSSLEWCVKNAFSESDSDNVGRCILHATEIQCQDSIQGLRFTSYHMKENFNYDKDNQILLANERFQSAISIYPMKEPNDVFKLTAYFCKVSLVEIKEKIVEIRETLTNMTKLCPAPYNKTSWPIGNHKGNTPNNRFDLLRWDRFNLTHIFLDTDFSNKRELKGANLKDIQYVLNASIKTLSADHNNQLEYKTLLNGFRRFDPSRGMDYRFDISFMEKTTGKNINKRVEVCKPLGNVEVIPMPYVTENSRVNLVLLVYPSQKDEVKSFIDKYQAITMDNQDKTFLMLVLLYDPTLPSKGSKDDIYIQIKSLALSASEKFKRDGSKIAWISVKLPQSLKSFNGRLLDIAITDLTIKKFNPDSLILRVQPNMELRQDYFNRVRMNTILGRQVFSPIPFNEFNPDIVYNYLNTRPKDLDINKTYGHYDYKSTVHIAFYASDYLNARKGIQEFVPVVKYDRNLSPLFSIDTKSEVLKWLHGIYALFIHASNLHVFRATEPGLRLRYMPLECNHFVNEQSQFANCIKNRNFNLGSRSQLAKMILDYKNQRKVN